jgi:hypothetical protein
MAYDLDKHIVDHAILGITSGGGGAVTGTGTAGVLPIWLAGGVTLGDSHISDRFDANRYFTLDVNSGGRTNLSAFGPGGLSFVTDANGIGVDGPSINFQAGPSTSGEGGFITFQPGGTASGTVGHVTFIDAGNGGAYLYLYGGTATDAGQVGLAAGNAVGSSNAGVFTLASGNADDNGNGGNFEILCGDGGSVSGSGGGMSINSGGSNAAGDGGPFNMSSGNAGGVGDGGAYFMQAGSGGSTSGNGGNYTMAAGGATDGLGGFFLATAGDSVNNTGGAFELHAGVGYNGLGGGFSLTAGNGDLGGGSFAFIAGNGLAGDTNGGDVDFQIGLPSGAGNPGRYRFLNSSSVRGRFDFESLTGNRIFTFPDATGTIMLLPSSPATYTESNVTTDRSYDADATSLNELADIVGTLLADLRAQGIIA